MVPVSYTHLAQVGRTEGMENKLKEHSNWNMLDKQSGEFTQAKGQEVMESFLKSYDDIDAVSYTHLIKEG